MKHFVMMCACALAIAGNAQSTNYCPDVDEDGLIGVSDVLAILSYFGESWPNCSEVQSGTDSLFAFVLMEPGPDVQCSGDVETDLCSHMLENYAVGTWFGFWISGVGIGFNTEDASVYLDWPGWQTGTENNLLGYISAPVPQVSGGVDFYGNHKNAYLFETMQVPPQTERGNTFFSFWIPLELMADGDELMTTVGTSYNGSANCFWSTNVSSSFSAVDVVYTGENWPQTTYRVFAAPLNSGLNLGSATEWNNDFYYFKGGSN